MKMRDATGKETRSFRKGREKKGKRGVFERRPQGKGWYCSKKKTNQKKKRAWEFTGIPKPQESVATGKGGGRSFHRKGKNKAVIRSRPHPRGVSLYQESKPYPGKKEKNQPLLAKKKKGDRTEKQAAITARSRTRIGGRKIGGSVILSGEGKKKSANSRVAQKKRGGRTARGGR